MPPTGTTLSHARGSARTLGLVEIHKKAQNRASAPASTAVPGRICHKALIEVRSQRIDQPDLGRAGTATIPGLGSARYRSERRSIQRKRDASNTPTASTRQISQHNETRRIFVRSTRERPEPRRGFPAPPLRSQWPPDRKMLDAAAVGAGKSTITVKGPCALTFTTPLSVLNVSAMGEWRAGSSRMAKRHDHVF